jgi:hypothetical protein
MGIVSELLANDTDGKLRRHIFRVVSFTVYCSALLVMLLLAGLVWRMYTGSEVELFGLRVAHAEKTEKPEPLPKEKEATAPKLAQAPAANAPFILQNASSWYVIPGDLNACGAATRDALGRSQLNGFQGDQNGYVGFAMKAGGIKVDVFTRCLTLNGISIAIYNTVSGQQSASGEVLRAISNAFAERVGPVGIDRIVGTVDRQFEYYNWQNTTFPSPEACSAFASQVHNRQNPTWRRGDGPAIFAFIGATRVTTICIRDGDRVTIITATNSFSQEEAIALRDRYAKEFEPMRRPM